MSVNCLVDNVLAVAELAWSCYNRVRECRKHFIELKIGAESLLINVKNLSQEPTIQLIREYINADESNDESPMRAEAETLLDGLLRTIVPLYLIFEDDQNYLQISIRDNDIPAMGAVPLTSSENKHHAQQSQTMHADESWREWDSSAWIQKIRFAFDTENLIEVRDRFSFQITALNLFMTRLTQIQLQKYSDFLKTNRTERIVLSDHPPSGSIPKSYSKPAQSINGPFGSIFVSQNDEEKAFTQKDHLKQQEQIHQDIRTKQEGDFSATELKKDDQQTTLRLSHSGTDNVLSKALTMPLDLDHRMLASVQQTRQRLALLDPMYPSSGEELYLKRSESDPTLKGKNKMMEEKQMPEIGRKNLCPREQDRPKADLMKLKATVEDEEDSDKNVDNHGHSDEASNGHTVEKVDSGQSGMADSHSLFADIEPSQVSAIHEALPLPSATPHLPLLDPGMAPRLSRPSIPDITSAPLPQPPPLPSVQYPNPNPPANAIPQNSQPNCNICSNSIPLELAHYACSSTKQCMTRPRFRYPPYFTSYTVYTVCQPCYNKSARNRCPGRGRSQCGKMTRHNPPDISSSQSRPATRHMHSDTTTATLASAAIGMARLRVQTPTRSASMPRPTTTTTITPPKRSPIPPSSRSPIHSSSRFNLPSSSHRPRRCPNVISISPLDPSFNHRTTTFSPSPSPSTHSYLHPSRKQPSPDHNFTRMSRMLNAADRFHGLT